MQLTFQANIKLKIFGGVKLYLEILEKVVLSNHKLKPERSSTKE